MGWGSAHCKILLFCAKTIVKESCNFELARLKMKKKKENMKEKHFVCLATFWFTTFAMLFMPLGMLFVMKTLDDEW